MSLFFFVGVSTQLVDCNCEKSGDVIRFLKELGEKETSLSIFV